jgi:hypothetical protein
MAGFEADLYGNESPTVKTKRIFDQSAPFAAAGIVDMALHGSSESVRLKASQYVVDRVLGPVGKDDSEDALDKFLSGIEKLANQGHAES